MSLRLYWKIISKRGFNFSPVRLFNFGIYFVVRPLIAFFKITKLPFFPVSSFLWVTSRCSKDCDFCPYHHELNENNSRDELSFDEFKQLMNHEAFTKSLHIGFYGGEPFLNKDVFKMIGYAQDNGLLTTITTNGLHIKQRAKELRESTPDLLVISYYHEDHDKLVSGLNELPQNTVLRLNFVLSKDSLPYITKALEVALEFNFDVFSIDPISERERKHEKVIFSDTEEFQKLKIEILKLTKNSRLSIKFPNTLSKNLVQRPGCYFMWDTNFVRKDKKWAPCCEWKLEDYYPSEDFDWNGTWYLTQRRGLLENKTTNDYCTNCIYQYDHTMNI